MRKLNITKLNINENENLGKNKGSLVKKNKVKIY